VLIRISSYFVAGIIIKESINKCAPIIKYMKNWNFAKIKRYCLKKNWKLEIIQKGIITGEHNE